MPKKILTASCDALFLTTVTWLPVAAIRLAPWNYKIDDDESLARFKASIQAGAVTPLHVAKLSDSTSAHTHEVLDGNHRLSILFELGATKVPVYDHGDLSEVERKALSLRYNGQWFATETLALARCLEDIEMNLPPALDLLPYSDAEFSHLVAALSADLQQVDNTLLEEEEPKKHRQHKERASKTVVCPNCNQSFTL